MLKERIQEELNGQLNRELFSAYVYLSMTAYFENQNLPGFANWMRMQAEEELAHALKFYSYIIEREGRVTLQPVDGPQHEWDSPLAAFEDAYAHEVEITECINRLSGIAADEKDRATEVFLQWFITEQVEELSNTGAAVERLRLVGDSPQSLFLLDLEMAKRKPESEGTG